MRWFVLLALIAIPNRVVAQDFKQLCVNLLPATISDAFYGNDALALVRRVELQLNNLGLRCPPDVADQLAEVTIPDDIYLAFWIEASIRTFAREDSTFDAVLITVSAVWPNRDEQKVVTRGTPKVLGWARHYRKGSIGKLATSFVEQLLDERELYSGLGKRPD